MDPAPEMTMRKWYQPILVVAAFATSLAAYPRLPARMVIHWGFNDQPNGWAGRALGAFGLPALMILFAVLLGVLPDVDPRQESYEKFRPSYEFIGNALLTSILACHLFILAQAVGFAIPPSRVAPGLVGLVLIGVGNVFPRLRANSLMGIRTPWSLSDDTNWARTHRVGGYLLVASGILWLASAVAPGLWMTRVALASAFVAVAASFAMSMMAQD
jgi:uncharacterized membrane protein